MVYSRTHNSIIHALSHMLCWLKLIIESHPISLETPTLCLQARAMLHTLLMLLHTDLIYGRVPGSAQLLNATAAFSHPTFLILLQQKILHDHAVHYQ